MTAAHYSLALFLFALASGFASLPSQRPVGQGGQPKGDWRNHPALAEPDGQSHRGGKMVAADITDPRVLKELSRRYRELKPLRIVERDGKTIVLGAEDFEKRQEYLLRLLDYYWFSKQRLVGMTRTEVEAIFGPLGNDAGQAHVAAGRDTLCLWFQGGRVTGAFYAMGY
jgi:hypothetical protein